ncbi:MAG: Type 1 glutamine amidotransferase-like domain-containing protein [Bacteroidota bacterium]
MHLLLSSRALANEEMTNLFLSFAAGCKHVAILTTAAMVYKEKNRNTVLLTHRLQEMEFQVSFIDVAFDNPSKLKESDLTIITGGNPYYLLHHLRQSGADKVLTTLIQQQHPVMGISAGLLVLLQNLSIIDWLTPEMNTINLQDKQCLGLINEVIIPHYDRFIAEGKISTEKVDAFEYQIQQPIIRVGEYQALYVKNGEGKLIGTSPYVD